MDEIFSVANLYADEDVPSELYGLVSNGLCTELKARLDELPNAMEYLTALSWHGEEQLTLLMVASLHGHNDIVYLLLTHFDSSQQIELKGKILLPDQTRIDGATALYCACYRGYFHVATVLIELGKANVKQNTADYPGCSLLLHACILNRLDIVGFLIENGYSDANERKSDHANRMSALMLVVDRGYTSLVEYLIDHAADVNYSCFTGNTDIRKPLLLAAARNHLDAFRLLYAAGAKANTYGNSYDSVITVAIKHESHSILPFLFEESLIAPDDLERMACSSITSASTIEQLQDKLPFLRIAIQRRQFVGLRKVCPPPMSIYDYQQECQTTDELNLIVDNRDRLFIETLLVRERLTWPPKDKTMNKILEDYSTMLASREEFSKCLDVLTHLYYLDQKNGGDVGLHMFIWFFCQMLTMNRIIWVDRFVEVGYFSCKSSEHKYDERDVNNALFMVVIATKVAWSIEACPVEPCADCFRFSINRK